jgi:hypothetical protein
MYIEILESLHIGLSLMQFGSSLMQLRRSIAHLRVHLSTVHLFASERRCKLAGLATAPGYRSDRLLRPDGAPQSWQKHSGSSKASTDEGFAAPLQGTELVGWVTFTTGLFTKPLPQHRTNATGFDLKHIEASGCNQ